MLAGRQQITTLCHGATVSIADVKFFLARHLRAASFLAAFLSSSEENMSLRPRFLLILPLSSLI